FTSEDDVVRATWQACSRRAGLLEEKTQPHLVRDFLAGAKQQKHAKGPLDHLTCHGSVVGTPQYMAPEQAQGRLKDIDPRTDVYALGGILYELLTGEPPFRVLGLVELLGRVVAEAPIPPRQLNQAIPTELEAVCLKCLEKDPGRRYSSA